MLFSLYIALDQSQAKHCLYVVRREVVQKVIAKFTASHDSLFVLMYRFSKHSIANKNILL